VIHHTSIKKLSQWFESTHRVLPWRSDPAPYKVWISEIMLQQTQVVTVLPYFDRFMSEFPTVKKLAEAPLEKVLAQWSGLGYYRRARSLHAAAKVLVAEGFPTTREGWEALPGIGPYTAGAILSIAYGKAEAILDGNVERVLSRVYRYPSRDKKKLWEWSAAWVQQAEKLSISPSVLNQALMELGATVCKPKQPKCEICPLNKSCLAFKEQDMECYPVKAKRAETVLVQEKRVCLVDADGKVFLSQPKKGEWREGLWDFPETVKLPRGAKKAGEVLTSHVVTKHKIKRVTEVFQVKRALNLKEEGSWLEAVGSLEFPHSSAFKKTWQKVISTFPEVLPSE